MQLDKTHVVIRVRTLSELGDLSLLMIRRYPEAFFQCFFTGAACWIIADAMLLGWIPMRMASESVDESFDWQNFFRYLIWMITLVSLQTPLAGIFSTLYLGQAVFEEQPTWRSVLRDQPRVILRSIWGLGGLGWLLPAMILVGYRCGEEAHLFFDLFVPATLLLVMAIGRGHRPFVPEMLLLECCPLRRSSSDGITLKQRSKALHRPIASDLVGRYFAVSVALVALAASIYYSLIFVRGIAWGDWSTDPVALVIFLPLAMWLTASLSVIMRFLGYLDTRIRLEGWDVDLAMRAEAARQFGDEASAAAKSDSSRQPSGSAS